MKSRPLLFGAAGLLFLAALALLLVRPSPWPETAKSPALPAEGPGEASGKNRSNLPETRRAEAETDGRSFLPEVAAVARSLGNPQGSAEQDIQTLQNLFESYRRVMGKNPTGLNFEIVQALSGANLKRYAVLPPDLPGINAKGELMDRWGTPYFFHCLTDDIIEIQSAGQDRLFGSADDIGRITQL